MRIFDYISVLKDIMGVYGKLIYYKDSRAFSTLPLSSYFRRGLRYFKPLGIQNVKSLIDIGANRGRFLFPAISYFKPRISLAIEPIPYYSDYLKREMANYSGSESIVYEGVISNISNKVEFNITEYQASSSLFSPIISAGTAYGKSFNVVKRITVDAITLDCLVQKYFNESVDLIKIDVQGAERLVIEGGKETISKCKYLILEILFERSYDNQADFFELDTLLRGYGMRLGTFFNLERKNQGYLLQCDALYVQI